MHPYSFTISLRANHPTSDLSFLSALLKLEQKHGWAVGDERKTPKGTSLGGIRLESFWAASITLEETSSEVWQLEDLLERSVNKLIAHKKQLREFFETGGSMHYFVGLFGARNFGVVLSPSLMAKLSRSNLELQLDVYPYADKA